MPNSTLSDNENKQTHPPKKIHVETWGCQMNSADSERIYALMAQKGYQPTLATEDADLIVLNTCNIREKARHKVVSRLGLLRDMKSLKPGLKIALAGCVAQAEGKSLLKELPYLDVVVGPGTIDDLPKLITEHGEKSNVNFSLGFQKMRRDLPTPNVKEIRTVSSEEVATASLADKNEVSRYLNINQGCNNFCTFCVVPFTRGPEISRHPDDIAADAEALIRQGAKEITLLGQNVNSYGLDLMRPEETIEGEHTPFIDLLLKIAALDGLERLRFTTSNPHDFTYPLAQVFKLEPKLGRYIHLPVQSGSDSMLEAMHRKTTVEEYFQRLSWLREIHPDMAISSDLIVGFPGESDQDFDDTLSLLKKARFSFVFAFKYSPRKGTAASRFKQQIDESIKTQRLAELNKIQDQITLEHNLGEIGEEREVLVLYKHKKEENTYYGRTLHNRLVKIHAEKNIVGRLMPVCIREASKIALVGTLL